MDQDKGFSRIAGTSALLMTLFMIANGAALVAALKDPAAAFNDAAALLAAGPGAAGMFHASMVFDLLAYLAFAPIAVFCWSRLRSQWEARASLFAACGLAYTLLGASGAVVTDAVVTPLLRGYAGAPAAEQASMRLIAASVNQAVSHGLWNPLEVFMVSLWFLGFALLLWRRKRGLAMLALVIGAVGLLDPLGWMIGSSGVLTAGALGTAPMPVWAAWFGIDVLRGPRQAAWAPAPEGANE